VIRRGGAIRTRRLRLMIPEITVGVRPLRDVPALPGFQLPPIISDARGLLESSLVPLAREGQPRHLMADELRRARSLRGSGGRNGKCCEHQARGNNEDTHDYFTPNANTRSAPLV
jgi:hypothetical protein